MALGMTNRSGCFRIRRVLCVLFVGLGVTLLHASVAWAGAIQEVSFSSIDNDPNATQVIFDDYVSPPPGKAFTGRVYDGQNSPGTFTGFIAPDSTLSTQTPLPPPVGVVVDAGNGPNDSDDFVIFEDPFSGRSVSELFAGSFAGNTLTLSFFDPNQPSVQAAVSGFAVRMGGISQTHSIQFFDAGGVEVPTAAGPVATVSSGDTEVGFLALDEDGLPTAVIHRVVFTTSFASSVNDAWDLGSFTAPSTSTDLAFTGFTTDVALIPEPAALLLLTLGTLTLARRARHGEA